MKIKNTRLAAADAAKASPKLPGAAGPLLEAARVCRLCLAAGAELAIFREDSKLPSKIEICCTLQIYENDGLPDHICSDCAATLELAANFRVQSQESDRLLRAAALDQTPQLLQHLLQQQPSNLVKTEFPADDDDGGAASHEDLPDPERTDSPEPTLRQGKKKKIKTENPPLKKFPRPRDESNLCTVCGQVFLKRSTYHSHIRSHRVEAYECSECGKAFKGKEKLKEHQITHFGVKNIPCSVCGKMFTSRAYVTRHMDRVHKRLRVVRCSLCGKQLACNAALKSHMKTHTGEMEFACEICGKRFTYKTSLKIHRRTHTGERPYGCKFCDKRYADLRTLVDHELLHTGETPYSCPACQKGFAQLSNMKSHFRYNHKGEDLADYPSYKKRRKDEPH